MKKYLLLFLCSLIAFAYGENYALIIGNSNYHELSDLRNPVNDAQDLARSLQGIGFNVSVHYDLSEDAMFDAISSFKSQLSSDDLALFYFAGHGLQVDDVNYLAPVDTRLDSLQAARYSSLEANYVLDELRFSGAQVTIMILDACRNTPDIPNETRSFGRGLARMDAGTGTVIAYATSPGDIAYDGTGRNSPYMTALKSYIVDTSLDIEEVFKQTRYAVVEATKNLPRGSQQPREDYGLSAPVYFARGHTPPTPPSPPSRTLSLRSQPSGASVYVDGQYLGTTPLNNANVPSNAHSLRLELNGYEAYRSSLDAVRDVGVASNIDTVQLKINSPNELVRRARQGSTLHLAATTFRLSSSLELSGDVRLIGQGYQQTRIVSSASEYVVRYTGGGTFAAQGVGFGYTGNQKANVVRVDNGTLDIDSCQFTGGKFDAEKVWGGSGLWIKGSTRGTVRNSLFNDNGLHGIEVNGNAQPRLEQNRLHDNTWSGVAYFDSAGGSAIGNESYGNGYHGIAVQENAQPRLEQNRLHDNTQSGIVYFDQAGGSARNNQSYNNQLRGIYVASTANPSLSNNTTYGNLGGNVRDLR